MGLLWMSIRTTHNESWTLLNQRNTPKSIYGTSVYHCIYFSLSELFASWYFRYVIQLIELPITRNVFDLSIFLSRYRIDKVCFPKEEQQKRKSTLKNLAQHPGWTFPCLLMGDLFSSNPMFSSLLEFRNAVNKTWW